MPTSIDTRSARQPPTTSEPARPAHDSADAPPQGTHAAAPPALAEAGEEEEEPLTAAVAEQGSSSSSNGVGADAEAEANTAAEDTAVALAVSEDEEAARAEVAGLLELALEKPTPRIPALQALTAEAEEVCGLTLSLDMSRRACRKSSKGHVIRNDSIVFPHMVESLCAQHATAGA